MWSRIKEMITGVPVEEPEVIIEPLVPWEEQHDFAKRILYAVGADGLSDTEYKNYVGKMAGAFADSDGINRKLKEMVEAFKRQLTVPTLTAEETQYYRACVNVCYLLIEFGEEMKSQHQAHLQGVKADINVFDNPDSTDAFTRLNEKLK